MGRTEQKDRCAALCELRNIDNAFLWLDRAARQKDPGMQWIRGDPMLDDLVKNPRYAALLRRINLE